MEIFIFSLLVAASVVLFARIGCRSVAKIAIASIGVAAVVFATTYKVESAKLLAEWRRIEPLYLEARSRGEIWTFCGPRPVHYATGYCLLALFTSPIVLLGTRGVWICLRRTS
jgi:hypothetical protein